MINVDRLMQFLDFVKERHSVWEKRQTGEPQPWTADPILAEHKFTNVFRVLDPGSQFVFELVPPDLEPREALARLFLYRYTNLPSAWQAYRDSHGGFPLLADLEELDKFWRDYRNAGNSVFNGAYVSAPMATGEDKATSLLRAADRAFNKGNIASEFFAQITAHNAFQVLRSINFVGDFMAMQILTDWGYTAQCSSDTENYFVIQGPGSLRGAKVLDQTSKPLDTLYRVHSALLEDFDCPFITVGPKNYRAPSWMDVQNCLCEYSKYVRYEGKARSGKAYSPAHPGPQKPPVLPKHW